MGGAGRFRIGMGINLTEQGDTIFATWFTFGQDGKPLWLVAAAARTGPNVYAGKLYTGPAPHSIRCRSIR